MISLPFVNQLLFCLKLPCFLLPEDCPSHVTITSLSDKELIFRCIHNLIYCLESSKKWKEILILLQCNWVDYEKKFYQIAKATKFQFPLSFDFIISKFHSLFSFLTHFSQKKTRY